MSLQWIRDLGVKLPDAPNLESIMVVIVLIVGACAIGWFIAARAGSAVAGRLHRFGTSTNVLTSGVVTSIIRYTIDALLLLIVGNAVRLSPLALMILAFALGMSVAILLFRLFVAFRISRMIATGLALLGLVATTAATLGGLTPLIDGLDAVGFTVGARRFSLLAVFNGIAIVALLYVVAKAVNHVLIHLIGRSSALDATQRVLVQKLAGIAVIVVAILLGIDLLGIDLTALTVFSGAAGLAIGFGLQKTFGNLIAGLILLMDRSVKPGDVIVVGDTFGAVSKIGVRAVSVVTRDGKEHLIPNEQLMTEPVENWSYSSKNVRVHVSVGVSYNCDLALAQRLMIEAATAATRVLADPKPSVWLKAFGDSSVDHDILVWIMDPELGVGNIRSDILNRIWVLFAEHGIEIPFPQRDVHIRSAPAGKTTA